MRFAAWNEQTLPILALAMVAMVAIVLGFTVTPAMAQEAAAVEVEQSAYAGTALYDTYCESCHGTEGKGDGGFAASLRKPPANLTQIAKQNGGTYPAEQVYRIIDGSDPVPGHGGGDMPLWGDAFSRSRDGSSPEAVKARVDALVRHLRMLQEKP